MKIQRYQCLSCKATKTIEVNPMRDPVRYAAFEQELPETVVCGVRGCETEQVRVDYFEF